MHPHEDEQIVTDHLAVIRAAAHGLITARLMVELRGRQAHAQAAPPTSASEQAQPSPPHPTQTAPRPSATSATVRGDREVLIARWAAAEAARGQAASVADAWGERMRRAGIDPEQVKTTAADMQAGTVDPENSPRAAEQSATTEGPVRAEVIEQLTTQFVDEQLTTAQRSQPAAAHAATQDAVAANTGADPGKGGRLVDQLGELTADVLNDSTRGWKTNNRFFKQAVADGVDPRTLIDAARTVVADAEAYRHTPGLIAVRINEAMHQAVEDHRRARSEHIRRLITATEVNRGTATRPTTQAPHPEPAATMPERDVAVEL